MGHVACKSSVEPSINITTLPSKHLMEWDTTSVISVTLIVSFLPDADVVVRVSVSDQITLTGDSACILFPNAELNLLSQGSGCPLQAGTGHGRPGRAPGRC